MNRHPETLYLCLQRIPSWIRFLLLSILFSIIHVQEPLYSDNQNTKFLHGMADAGWGFLHRDWTAGTVDGLPLFSLLIQFVYTWLHPFIIYVFFGFLLGIFFVSVKGSVAASFGFKPLGPRSILLGLLILILYSGLFNFQILYEGVAGQYLLGHYFQNCTFGVFIFLSIYLGIKDKWLTSSLTLALASLIHPTYLLHSLIILSAYIYLLLKEKRSWRKLLAATLPYVMVTVPYVLSINFLFQPTTPEIYQRSLEILARIRIPQHSLISEWFEAGTVLKLLIIFASLWVLRGTKLFTIQLFLVAATLLLTGLQAFTGSNGLALLAPWRTSVVMVPLGTIALFGFMLKMLPQSFVGRATSVRPSTLAVWLVLLTVLVTGGVVEQTKEVRKYNRTSSMGVMEYVDVHKEPSDMYLIPARDHRFYRFRLVSGAPAFVTWKTHPYKDVQVIEWYERVRTADRVYQNIRDICPMLPELTSQHGITHIILPGKKPLDNCAHASILYNDSHYSLYQINATLSVHKQRP